MRVPESPLHGEKTVIRSATALDAELLVEWHAYPDVARFWDDETFTQGEMLARLARPDVDPYIIEEGDEPIGYLQAWFEDVSPDKAGLDMFLVPEARGRGLGPDASSTLARWLLGPGGMRSVTVDPYLSNERAIRGWAKAGFMPIEERPADDEKTGPWLLMVMT